MWACGEEILRMVRWPALQSRPWSCFTEVRGAGARVGLASYLKDLQASRRAGVGDQTCDQGSVQKSDGRGSSPCVSLRSCWRP